MAGFRFNQIRIKAAGEWLADLPRASAAASKYAGFSVASVVVGGVAHFVGVRVELGHAAVTAVIGVGIAATVLLSLGGLARSLHPVTGQYSGITRVEARLVLAVLVGYLVVLQVCLP
jgi:hypothetical protein